MFIFFVRGIGSNAQGRFHLLRPRPDSANANRVPITLILVTLCRERMVPAFRFLVETSCFLSSASGRSADAVDRNAPVPQLSRAISPCSTHSSIRPSAAFRSQGPCSCRRLRQPGALLRCHQSYISCVELFLDFSEPGERRPLSHFTKTMRRAGNVRLLEFAKDFPLFANVARSSRGRNANVQCSARTPVPSSAPVNPGPARAFRATPQDRNGNAPVRHSAQATSPRASLRALSRLSSRAHRTRVGSGQLLHA